MIAKDKFDDLKYCLSILYSLHLTHTLTQIRYNMCIDFQGKLFNLTNG